MKCIAAYPEVTKTLIAITQDPTSLTLESVHIRVLERWTVLMYSKNCSVKSANEARKLLFTHRLKSLDQACFIPAGEACPAHCRFFLEAIPVQNSRDFQPQ